MEEAGIAKNKASLDEIEVDLAEAVIRASIDGVITNDFSRTPGEMIAGDTPIVELIDVDQLYVRVTVAEQDASRIKPGMPANISILKNTTDDVLTGTVWRIQPTVDAASRTTRVDVLIDNPAVFRPGMFAGVFFIEHQLAQATVLPATAVCNDKDGAYVWLADGDSARRHGVELGPANGSKVSIKNGLPDKTRILVSGTNNLKDGDKIIDPDFADAAI